MKGETVGISTLFWNDGHSFKKISDEHGWPLELIHNKLTTVLRREFLLIFYEVKTSPDSCFLLI